MNNSVGYVPYVVEKTMNGESRHDIWSRLMMDRIIFLGQAIDDDVANAVVAQLLFLSSEDPDKDIKMYINSPGGVITAGMAIYDTMQLIKPDVQTICVGQAASMGAMILSGGAKGKRKILPNSRVLIHQPLGGARGQASDIEISAREILRWKSVLNNILSSNTGQPLDVIQRDTDRDTIMDAEASIKYGIVDSIVSSTSESEKKECITSCCGG